MSVERAARQPVLAIDGGEPVRTRPMPPRRALGPAERAMIDQALDHYAARDEDPGYQGHFEGLYAAAFAESLGGGYADAVATGTAALYVAVAALGLPEGSEVLVSPITDPGTLSAIVLNGLTPRLVDSAPGSYNADAERVFARVTDRTRAILLVHAAGQAADIEAISGEAGARDLRLIEDCSQAHGATAGGRPVGTFGDIAAFSTMYRKAHISGGCGGVVFSRDENLHRQALAHADRGKPRWQPDFDDRNPEGFLFPALNLHADELSCAVAIASLGRLEETIARRRAFVAEVSDAIAAQSSACRPYPMGPADSPFFLPVMVEADRLACSKTDFAKAVRAEGIGLNPDYRYVMADWTWARPHLADDLGCPNARDVRDRSFNLYLNENYGSEEAEDIARAITKVEACYLAEVGSTRSISTGDHS